VVEDPSLPEVEGPAGDRTALLWARALIALADGDDQEARRLALEALEIDREKGPSNSLNVATWWTGWFFGPEAVGGQDELEGARRRLEEIGWRRALEEPELVSASIRTGR
jgi:hypothetical protein